MRKQSYPISCAAAAFAALLLVPQMVFAQDAISAPAQKQIGGAKAEMVPSLIVMNARGATLQGGTLTLSGISPNSIIFADRPVRSAGHALTTHLLEEWTPNPDGSDDFAKNPPNTTVSVFSKDGAKVSDAVVVLKSPKLDGEKLTFAVDVLEGDLTAQMDRHRSSSTSSACRARLCPSRASLDALPIAVPGTLQARRRRP